MAESDDDVTKIEADDALLTALAARADTAKAAGDDAAGLLLAEIARSVDALAPHTESSGSGRRTHRRRRGGLWGLSLGVSIAVAAGGGLSAAATDRLPEPMQRLMIEAGQSVPAAEAAPEIAATDEPVTPLGDSADRSWSAERGWSAAAWPDSALPDIRAGWFGAADARHASRHRQNGERSMPIQTQGDDLRQSGTTAPRWPYSYSYSDPDRSPYSFATPYPYPPDRDGSRTPTDGATTSPYAPAPYSGTDPSSAPSPSDDGSSAPAPTRHDEPGRGSGATASPAPAAGSHGHRSPSPAPSGRATAPGQSATPSSGHGNHGQRHNGR